MEKHIKEPSTMQFEKKLNELEQIVQKLEDKNITLADGITLFEQGLLLTKDCLKSLNESKSRITSVKEEMGKLLEQSL